MKVKSFLTVLVLATFPITTFAENSSYGESVNFFYMVDFNGFIYRVSASLSSSFVSTNSESEYRGVKSGMHMFGIGYTNIHNEKDWNTTRISFIYMPKQGMAFNEWRMLESEVNGEKMETENDWMKYSDSQSFANPFL